MSDTEGWRSVLGFARRGSLRHDSRHAAHAETCHAVRRRGRERNVLGNDAVRVLYESHIVGEFRTVLDHSGFDAPGGFPGAVVLVFEHPVFGTLVPEDHDEVELHAHPGRKAVERRFEEPVIAGPSIGDIGTRHGCLTG